MDINKLQVISIRNQNNMGLKVINYGATIVNLFVPDREDNLVDVIVGLSTAENYIQNRYAKVKLYLGSSIGRYAGRISKGSFAIDGNIYKINHEYDVHLHGFKGFDERYWEIEVVANDSVIFSYFSPDLEEGYPGNLRVFVKYEVTDDNALNISYSTTTDQATPVNLTSHPYFNLNGKGSVLDHEVFINSDQHLEVDAKLLPTGTILDSKNTAFDRNTVAALKENSFEGFDSTFVLNKEKIKASLYSKQTGIKMTLYTNQEALVVYTPKKFPDLPFKEDYGQVQFPAICLEAQNFPDSPNNANFPNSILQPKEMYSNTIKFVFEKVLI